MKQNIVTTIVSAGVGASLVFLLQPAPVVVNGTVTYERIDDETVKVTTYLVHEDTITVTKLKEYMTHLESQANNPGTGPMSKEGLVKVKDYYVNILDGANRAGVEKAAVELDALISQGKVKPD